MEQLHVLRGTPKVAFKATEVTNADIKMHRRLWTNILAKSDIMGAISMLYNLYYGSSAAKFMDMTRTSHRSLMVH